MSAWIPAPSPCISPCGLWGVGAGDEVITVPNTFIATLEAIIYTGATPVFVDVDPETWLMDPVKLADAITPKTKAIMPVHLFGHLLPWDEISAVAGEIPIIEDACQAHGARYKGRRAGSLGVAAGSASTRARTWAPSGTAAPS